MDIKNLLTCSLFFNYEFQQCIIFNSLDFSTVPRDTLHSLVSGQLGAVLLVLRMLRTRQFETKGVKHAALGVTETDFTAQW